MSLPANLINLVLNADNNAHSATGTQLIATNLFTNPLFAAATTGVTAVNGTGGTSALTVATYPALPWNGFSSTTAQQKWSVATTAVSGGLDFLSVSPGTGLYYVSADVYVSVTQRLQWTFTGTATVTVTSAPATVVTGGTWTRMEAFINVTVAGTVIPHLYATAGTSAVNWPINGILSVGNVMMVHGIGASLPRFPVFVNQGLNAITVSWTGTANASTQTWNAPTVNGVGASGGSLPYYDNEAVTYQLQAPAPAPTLGSTQYAACMAQGSANPGLTFPTVTFPTGVTGNIALWVVTEMDQPAQSVTLTCTGGLAGTATIFPTPGVWTKVMFTGVTTAGATTYTVTLGGTPVAGTTFYVNSSLAIVGSYTNYFSGSYQRDPAYYAFWTGATDNSTSQLEYRGVWVEQNTGAGAPTVQVYASGLGGSASTVQVTRTADGETWTVPGWFDRSVIDSDTSIDFTPPLGRPITYTLYQNGVQINQMAITVASATGWVQDPYDPSTAMPIQTVLGTTTQLAMAKGSLDSRTHVTNASRATVMGAKRQYSISGQRIADGAVIFIINAWQNDVSDRFKSMVTSASILLFRGLPSWGSVSGLAYMDGPVQEFAVNRYRVPGNNALTQWTITGDLVVPVARGPFTSTVTNDMVQANCAGVTNAAILARSGAKKNVDIKANPLSL
jgi:hypothetical protein